MVEPFRRLSRAPSVVDPLDMLLEPGLASWRLSLALVPDLLPRVLVVSLRFVCADAVLIAKAINAVVAKIAIFFIIISFLNRHNVRSEEKNINKKEKNR